MSSLTSIDAACPRCQSKQAAVVFASLDADRVAAQVADLLAGSFERLDCERCGNPFQPEHSMLFTRPTARTWIVMQPCRDRPHFAALEGEVEAILRQRFAEAPPALAPSLVGVRPRLVFGQHMLAEAVRVLEAGFDAGLLECAKLLAVRRHLARLVAYGPFELCFEHLADDGGLVHGIHVLPSGVRRGGMVLPADTLAEAGGARAAFEQLYPDLFRRPYISAARYLFDSLV